MTLLIPLLLSIQTRVDEPLREHVVQAHRIVLGRMEEVVLYEGPIDASGLAIASVRVDRCLVGPGDEALLYVACESVGSLPERGERAWFFLDSKPDGAWPDELAIRSASAVPADGTLWWAHSGWVRPPSGAHTDVILPDWLSAGRETATTDSVLVEIDEAIEGCLPAIHAYHVSIGGPPAPGEPGVWSLDIGPDRRVVENGTATGSISSERWQALLRSAEGAIRSLPETVGRNSGPCVPATGIVLRTRRGPLSVQLLETPPVDSPEAEAWEIALRVWADLPGSHKPKR